MKVVYALTLIIAFAKLASSWNYGPQQFFPPRPRFQKPYWLGPGPAGFRPRFRPRYFWPARFARRRFYGGKKGFFGGKKGGGWCWCRPDRPDLPVGGGGVGLAPDWAQSPDNAGLNLPRRQGRIRCPCRPERRPCETVDLPVGGGGVGLAPDWAQSPDNAGLNLPRRRCRPLGGGKKGFGGKKGGAAPAARDRQSQRQRQRPRFDGGGGSVAGLTFDEGSSTSVTGTGASAPVTEPDTVTNGPVLDLGTTADLFSPDTDTVKEGVKLPGGVKGGTGGGPHKNGSKRDHVHNGIMSDHGAGRGAGHGHHVKKDIVYDWKDIWDDQQNKGSDQLVLTAAKMEASASFAREVHVICTISMGLVTAVSFLL